MRCKKATSEGSTESSLSELGHIANQSYAQGIQKRGVKDVVKNKASHNVTVAGH